jgi:ubiquinone/menaquinone biosynthesis C-methylase UbiE
MSILRNFLKRHLLTSNTIRYRIEYRCAERAFEKIGRPVKRLLDAGAGSGEMSLMAQRAGHAGFIIGIEPMPSNFKLLQENYKTASSSEAINASLEEIPLDSSSVDCVLTTQVFEHIQDHGRAADEVSRVLEPGGYLIFSVPHPPEIFPNDGHVRPGYTEDEVRDLWQPCGFSILLTEYFFTLPTLMRLATAQKMPLNGRFLPIAYADKEKHLSNAERQAAQPYGILCLLRKDL